jgi:hypothetical protein
VYNAPRFFKGKTPQEQIVDQAEDCRVCADRERERNHGDDGKPWRFSQRPERVFEVGDHKDWL